MREENTQESYYEKWPIPSTLPDIFGTNFEYMVRGWLVELSKIISSPVIFVFHDQSGTDKESAFLIYDDTRDYHVIASTLCDWLRNNKTCNNINEMCCDKHDKAAAITVYRQYQPGRHALPSGWVYFKNGLTGVETEGIPLFTYPCPLTGLIEWVIPLFVNDKFACTVITGQFERDGKQKSVEEIREQLVSQYKIPNADELNVSEIIHKMGIKEPQVGDENRNEFFKKISIIQHSINKEYKEVAAYRIRGIQSKLLDMIWDKGGFYPKTHDMDMTSILGILPRFQVARTYLVDCTVYLKRVLGLDGLTVFMPSMSLDRLDSFDTSASIVEGVIVDDEPEKKKDDLLSYKRDFCSPEYKLNVVEAEWLNGQQEGHIPMLTYREEQCQPVLSGTGLHDLSRKILYIFAAKGYERYPVAYLFTLSKKSPDEVRNWGKQDSLIQELLEQLSTAYLAQWNMIFADYHRLSYEMSNRYLSHELGQIIAGMRVRVERFEEILSKVHANLDDYRLPRPLSELITDATVFAKDQYSYLQMFTTISKNAFFFTEKQNIIKEKFFPYDKFLYRLVSVYQAENNFYYRSVIIPLVSIQDPARPRLYADPVLLEQAVSNLLRNACKYSHSCTKIYIDAKLSEDGLEYLFSVTNFGIPIVKEEILHLFELGYRASNGKSKDATGMGFGLYIVKKFAEMHKGRLELKQTLISDYNIPFIKPYILSTYPQKDASVDQACREELKRLEKAGLFPRVVADRIPDNPFTHMYYINHIEDPTAEITFTVHIPIMKE